MALCDIQKESELMEKYDYAMELAIDAPIERVWASLTSHMGDWFVGEDEKPMGMKVEPWPGGRVFRDLGNDDGHFWATVQVIKRPYLLEISGPMCFTASALAYTQFRLEKTGDNSTLLKMKHDAIGGVPEDYLKGADEGWTWLMKGLKDHAEQHND